MINLRNILNLKKHQFAIFYNTFYTTCYLPGNRNSLVKRPLSKHVFSRTTTTRITALGRHVVLVQSLTRNMTTKPDHPSTICLADYDAYGFDLDHTLAKYKLVEMFNTAYASITDFLVDKKGYDESIKTDLLKYKEFIYKGLFLDIEKGHILKIADNGQILRATHGTRQMDTGEIQAAYGKDMMWEHTETVKKTVKNSNSAFRFFENYFDTPGLVAMARIIDLEDKKRQAAGSKEKIEYSQIWQDVLDSLINAYTYTNFALETGGYFPEVKKNADKYVEACSEDIKKWLRSLKQDNKCVFLVTSSFSDYADFLLNAILGPEWTSYFDINVFYARKPAFFTDTHPFLRIDNHQVKEPVTTLERGGFYYRGNHVELNKFIASITGKKEPKVVYFGDNITSDCYPSKMHAEWDTVLLLEEMDAEGYTCEDGTVGDQEPAAKKRKRGIEHSSLVTQDEIDYLISDVWGPFLYHEIEGDTGAKQMNTFWGAVISRYSDITVPSLEYLAGVPLDHKFKSFGARSGNTEGFHPGKPASLL